MKASLLSSALLASLLIGCAADDDHAHHEHDKHSHHHITQIRGGGNEPGWNIEIDEHQSGDYTFDMNSNYGDSTYQGRLHVDDQQGHHYYFVGYTQKKRDIDVRLIKQTCVDDADGRYPYTIEVQIEGLDTLTGCANMDEL